VIIFSANQAISGIKREKRNTFVQISIRVVSLALMVITLGWTSHDLESGS